VTGFTDIGFSLNYRNEIGSHYREELSSASQMDRKGHSYKLSVAQEIIANN